MTPNTDAPDVDALDAADDNSTDAPNDADNDSAYPKLIHFSLSNYNHNRKIAPNTKKTMKII